MTRMIRNLAIGLATLALAAGCSKITAIDRPAVQPGSADFTRFVALGTSLAAGTESGGTVERHQPYSYANQFARVIGGAPFDRYTIDQDGIDTFDTGPVFNLLSLDPLIIGATGHVKGTAGNQALATDYHNLGVPGAWLFDVADSIHCYHPADPYYHTAHFPWVARHRGTLLHQVARIQPTFITFEYGANEILGPSTQGSGTVFFDVLTWSLLLRGTLDGLFAVAPNAKVAIFTVPDPTDVPFARTFSWITRDDLGAPAPLIGPSGPLAAGTLVLLTAGDSLARGTGFPVGSHSYLTGAPGNGRPLRDDQILTPAEAASLQAAVQGYNAAIATEASSRGYAVVDLHAVFKDIAADGLSYGGQHYTTAFVTGGLFSLDGIHPSDLGYGIMVNALIDAVNQKYGAVIPRVDLSTCLTASSYRMTPAPGGRVPYVRDAERLYASMFPARDLPR